MKTIIAGSRHAHVDAPIMAQHMEHLVFWELTEVVSGCARGIDRCGESYAFHQKLPVTRFPAQWDVHGRRAGPIRNRQMADYAEAVVAYRYDESSRGTQDMINVAKERGMFLVVLVPEVMHGAKTLNWVVEAQHAPEDYEICPF